MVLLRRFLQQGWLGEVFEVHTVMSKVVGAEDRRGLAQYPGGILFELGGHIIDLVVGVLGEPAKVHAFPRHTSPLPDGLLDNMLSVFEYPRATATVKSSAVEFAGGERRHFVVCGTEGTFHLQPLDNPAARVAFSKPRESYRAGYQEVTSPSLCGMSTMPPTWPGSCAARKRPISRTSTTTLCNGRCCKPVVSRPIPLPDVWTDRQSVPSTSSVPRVSLPGSAVPEG